MEWWNVLVAILFVIGVTAYPGWNLVLRLESNYRNQIKIPSKPSKQSNELEKIFGI
ncbi:MAG: hypothetical protein ACW9W4_01170 [Candidatus Nitrosopumilus sp. bin_7KS]